MIAAIFCGLLAVALAFVVWAWIESARTATAQAVMIRHQRELIAGYRAELDALSIAGPRIDTTTGSHDALPIRDDIRQMLTDYVEGMWQHTQEMP